MCFSAEASFITAGLTGAIGVLTLTQVNHVREAPLAAIPLVFALQQAIEGVLWLTLPSGAGSFSSGLTFVYLLIAQVFWPVYAPAAVLLIEPGEGRRRYMRGLLALGGVVAAYLLWRLFAGPHGAQIIDDHIVYVTEQKHSDFVAVAYLAAVSLPLLLSSRRTVSVAGAIVLVGCVTAYVFYWQAFQSVWCFFAAAASAVLFGHFAIARRRHLRLNPA